MKYSDIDIVAEVSERRGISPMALMSRCRCRNLVYARIEIAKTLRERGYTIEHIGMILHRDHSTIVYYIHHAKNEVLCQ